MIILTVTSDLDKMVAATERMIAAEPPMEAAERETLAHAAGELIVPILADHTPHRSGALAASTTYTVIPGGKMVLFQQPAKSQPNQDGSGGGQYYVQWVVGGRGEVFPVNKKALAGPGFGPVKHAGPAAPNPYPDAAMRDADAPLAGLMAERGHSMLARLVTVL